jgi:hypothetical protein
MSICDLWFVRRGFGHLAAVLAVAVVAATVVFWWTGCPIGVGTSVENNVVVSEVCSYYIAPRLCDDVNQSDYPIGDRYACFWSVVVLVETLRHGGGIKVDRCVVADSVDSYVRACFLRDSLSGAVSWH